jgi:hypothetical protein
MSDGCYARLSAKYEYYQGDPPVKYRGEFYPERVFLQHHEEPRPLQSILPPDWRLCMERVDGKLLAVCVTRQEIPGEEDSVRIFLPDEEVSVHA